MKKIKNLFIYYSLSIIEIIQLNAEWIRNTFDFICLAFFSFFWP